MMEVNFDGLEQPLMCEYHNESMDALPELWDESSACFDPSELAVELRGEDGCNSPIWSTLVPTDDDEDAVACRTTNSAQVVLHDRLITDTTTFKKCSTTAPPPMAALPSLIFCPSINRRADQQQHSVYSITIDSRGQVEIVQDTSKLSSQNCIIIPDDPLSIGIKAEPASPAESLSDDDDDDEDDDYSDEDEGQCSSRKRSLPPARNQPATKLIKLEGNNNRSASTFAAAATSNTVNFVLPPTPPSSASSDNEGGNASPVRDVNSPKLDEGGNSNDQQRRSTTTSNRHPINSPLISYQPKGSTGVLQLTDEEKRTLLAEGYPVPTRLPLTKAEEKSLKKIRRKIKNKISAQESRRKKKEYMDTLERRAQELVDENTDYRQRLVQLETDNAALQVQLKRLQKLLTTKAADNNLSHQHDLLED